MMTECTCKKTSIYCIFNKCRFTSPISIKTTTAITTNVSISKDASFEKFGITFNTEYGSSDPMNNKKEIILKLKNKGRVCQCKSYPNL